MAITVWFHATARITERQIKSIPPVLLSHGVIGLIINGIWTEHFKQDVEIFRPQCGLSGQLVSVRAPVFASCLPSKQYILILSSFSITLFKILYIQDVIVASAASRIIAEGYKEDSQRECGHVD